MPEVDLVASRLAVEQAGVGMTVVEVSFAVEFLLVEEGVVAARFVVVKQVAAE